MDVPAHNVYHDLPDVAEFLQVLRGLHAHALPAVRLLLDPAREIIVTRAPGRLDLMGGIADYSGALVLQLPTSEATLAAIQRTSDRTLTIVSMGPDRADDEAVFTMSLAEFEENGRPISYAAAREYFARQSVHAWAAYVAGAFLVLMRERGVHFPTGARLFIRSQVPEGKGVSSSAAVEVASMTAIAAAYGVDVAPREMALLCQMVENLVVGAPCGVMDQMTSVCGEADRLLALLCQPAELQAPVSLPADLAVWGIDSGIRHAVSGADYTSVRVGAFMGYRILLELAALAGRQMPPDAIRDERWHGYLANVTPSEFEQSFAAHLPETLRGAEFIERYGETPDPVTTIDPTHTYAVRQPTAHPIYEHFRVRTFAALLGNRLASGAGNQPELLQNALLLGECMYQSHASYSACGLGSSGTDELVRLARAAGPEQEIYGAKITGGGSGGTVAILGARNAESAVLSIAAEYANITGHSPYVFQGSSPGAAAFGHMRLAGLS